MTHTAAEQLGKWASGVAIDEGIPSLLFSPRLILKTSTDRGFYAMSLSKLGGVERAGRIDPLPISRVLNFCTEENEKMGAPFPLPFMNSYCMEMKLHQYPRSEKYPCIGFCLRSSRNETRACRSQKHVVRPT